MLLSVGLGAELQKLVDDLLLTRLEQVVTRLSLTYHKVQDLKRVKCQNLNGLGFIISCLDFVEFFFVFLLWKKSRLAASEDLKDLTQKL